MSYITVDDVRAEGVTETLVPDDTYIEGRITLAQSFIEKVTGRIFEKKAGITIKVSGRGHDTIFMDIPPISESAISEVSINDEVLDSEYYSVYMPTVPDGRFNAQLIHLTGVWTKGNRNISIVGDFGFVEPNESTPPLIKELCLRLVMSNLSQMYDDDSEQEARIIYESLGDYSYRLSEKANQSSFQDPKIDNLIAMFKVKKMFGV